MQGSPSQLLSFGTAARFGSTSPSLCCSLRIVAHDALGSVNSPSRWARLLPSVLSAFVVLRFSLRDGGKRECRPARARCKLGFFFGIIGWSKRLLFGHATALSPPEASSPSLPCCCCNTRLMVIHERAASGEQAGGWAVALTHHRCGCMAHTQSIARLRSEAG